MELDEAFARHRSGLLALCYRLTGDIDDAEEAVQEAFARALERPPRNTDRPWKPWLVRVATNISLDALRRRKRRGYTGPWLPSPLSELDGEALLAAAPGLSEDRDASSQYELRETVSLAFLVALEALSPRQRAALVLKEAFEFSASEIGEILDVSEGSARMLLYRARKAMGTAAPEARRSLHSLEEESRELLSRLLHLLLAGDPKELAAILSEDARLVTDSGGNVTALPHPMVGASPVAKLLTRVAARRLPGSKTRLVNVNALPALWMEFARTERRQAPRALVACDPGPKGTISELFIIVNPDKLRRLGVNG